MADSNAIEQAVSRTLRDNLGRIHRAAEELGQAINDLVSACASTRPANTLPPMVRAQTSAASLSAALEVLSRFVTAALQPAIRSPLEQEIARATSLVTAELMTAVKHPQPELQHLITDNLSSAPGVDLGSIAILSPPDVSQFEAAVFNQESSTKQFSSDAVMQSGEEMMPPVADLPPAIESVFLSEPEAVLAHESVPDLALQIEVPIASEAAGEIPPQKEGQPVFDVAMLPEEERELHRRAYRVAKVSMQDIVMLHPEDVRIGRENKDLCFRLREDIEKAHREYGRRFESIYNHPVDYFYDWMVEILAGGNPEALGEYPYPSPVLRR